MLHCSFGFWLISSSSHQAGKHEEIGKAGKRKEEEKDKLPFQMRDVAFLAAAADIDKMT